MMKMENEEMKPYTTEEMLRGLEQSSDLDSNRDYDVEEMKPYTTEEMLRGLED